MSLKAILVELDRRELRTESVAPVLKLSASELKGLFATELRQQMTPRQQANSLFLLVRRRSLVDKEFMLASLREALVGDFNDHVKGMAIRAMYLLLRIGGNPESRGVNVADLAGFVEPLLRCIPVLSRDAAKEAESILLMLRASGNA